MLASQPGERVGSSMEPLRKTHDLHVLGVDPLAPPRQIKEEFPVSSESAASVIESRHTIESILNRSDRRLLVVVGPCSIHDEALALDYASRLNELRRRVADAVYVVMRVYFEKPRTTVGWRGYILDPRIDGSCDIGYGIRSARNLLCEITEMGIPVATEMLDPITPQYTADLVSWAAVGARTTESQTHREMASGLSMPVGFKNSTDGNLQVAIDGMVAARSRHSFLGIDQDGRTGVVRTSGNPHVHMIMRGGRNGPNYGSESISKAIGLLGQANLSCSVMVDCSHANSGKNYQMQEHVWHEVMRQRREGTDAIIGLMIESNINEGRQEVATDGRALRYGVSVTDECIDWKTTERLILTTAEADCRAPRNAN